MLVSDFDFELPDGLIAQEPCPDRDRSKLMVLDRKSQGIEHRQFFEILDYLRPGDLLVINDTRVIPARLLGNKTTGGKAEVFLIERSSGVEEIWECLVGGKRIRPGTIVEFSEGFKVEMLENLGEGRFMVRFHSEKPFDEAIEDVGHVPLPPYIKRVQSSEFGVRSHDKERYQTVFAEKRGAVAAPTAGLHFTGSLMEKIRDVGVEVVSVTLHVGAGTFLPVKVSKVEEHRMHPESYEISPETADRINKAKADGRRVVAVGTTSLRTLEAAATFILPLPQGEGKGEGGVSGVTAGRGRTSIFIYPGYKFKIVDALVTNFHIPKSTLLMLVSAFAGKDFIFRAYREAVEKRYRFYSYGDAMMII